jgi:hypothetical protein
MMVYLFQFMLLAHTSSTDSDTVSTNFGTVSSPGELRDFCAALRPSEDDKHGLDSGSIFSGVSENFSFAWLFNVSNMSIIFFTL